VRFSRPRPSVEECNGIRDNDLGERIVPDTLRSGQKNRRERQ
jgi:hypothetical protein